MANDRILICTVGGADCYGTALEFDAVRMKQGDRVRYSTETPDGKIHTGIGKFLFASFLTGEPHFEIEAQDGSSVVVFTGLGHTIEKA